MSKLQEFKKYSLNFLEDTSKDVLVKTIENTDANVSIRNNPFKNHLTYEHKINWCSDGFYLPEKPIFTLDPAFHSGSYYVQESSSMSLESFFKQIELPEDAIILDLCASPGGKSTHLLSLMQENQLLVSNEVIKSRTASLKENLMKWGCENIVITNNDASHFFNLQNFFDLIVVDAPCSGEGMFRKDKNAIEEWSIENVDICYKRQQRILSEIIPSIKDGGYLIYSTCTYNPYEDEENVKWILENHNFEEVKLSQKFENVYEASLGYKFMPHLTQGEGFYIACLRKKGELETLEIPKSKRSPIEIFRNIKDIKDTLVNNESLEFFIYNNVIKVYQKNHKVTVDYLARYLSIVYSGLDIGEIKGKELVPSHTLALSRLINKDYFKPVELNKTEALKYLKKELTDIESSNGINLATFNGNGMGFFKKIQNRINNNYPQEWRIRMEI
ncbi:MAG: RNA methyltransferase [Cytophagales bacterium]